MTASVRTTVVLPVKDGAPHLRELLPALLAQRVPGGHEILAIDSASSDGSAAILAAHGVRTLAIPAAAFDHGETRNQGARAAAGRVLVFLTQDALPVDEHVVARLADAVERDERVAGAFARQVPRPDADAVTRRDLAGWVACEPEPRLVFAGDLAAFDRLPALERYRLSVFDDVCSAVRRETLLAHPFAPTPFGEDVEWGLRMLRLGRGLAYVPDAAVVHSHRRAARALFRRNYLGHRLLARLFGLRTVPRAVDLARSSAVAIVRDLQALAGDGAGVLALAAAPLQSIAAVYGQYRGARDETLGRPYPAWSRAAP